MASSVSAGPVLLPEPLLNAALVVNVSGGKDSAGVVLALREASIPVHSYVFADTLWEHEATPEHIETMERVLGITVVRVGFPGGMEARARYRAGFPSRAGRWCTGELKVAPINDHVASVARATGKDVAIVVGNRAAESTARALQPEVEWEPERPSPIAPASGHPPLIGHYVWRPIQAWTVEDVLRAHHRHNLPMNPLYHMGHDRVGCYPCIFASKEEIRLIAQNAPRRIALIAELEREFTKLRAERNKEEPGRYAHPKATFFMGRNSWDPSPSIERVVEWSRTTRGGRQLTLLQEPPEGGCYRWGLCEAGGNAKKDVPP